MSASSGASIDFEWNNKMSGQQIGFPLSKSNHASAMSICRVSTIALVILVSLSLVTFSPINQVTANLAGGSSKSVISQIQPTNHAQQSPQDQEQKSALEAELNSIVQQHDALEGNNKMLAEAIISRLMVENLAGSGMSNGNVADLENDVLTCCEPPVGNELASADDLNAPLDQPIPAGPTGPEAMRLRKLYRMLQNYENFGGPYGAGINGGQVFAQFPALPSSQAATMKRAAMKMGNYLQQQQQQRSNYGRNTYDFGLGKRPDARFGDLLAYTGSAAQPVSQLGKRPSAHRYDFGLGKRVASPAYPRYDFGLGKRAPNRLRYDFGLGK